MTPDEGSAQQGAGCDPHACGQRLFDPCSVRKSHAGIEGCAQSGYASAARLACEGRVGDFPLAPEEVAKLNGEVLQKLGLHGTRRGSGTTRLRMSSRTRCWLNWGSVCTRTRIMSPMHELGGGFLKDQPNGVVTAQVLFDGARGVEVNTRTKIRDHERASIASDLNRPVRDRAKVGKRTFALATTSRQRTARCRSTYGTGTHSDARYEQQATCESILSERPESPLRHTAGRASHGQLAG